MGILSMTVNGKAVSADVDPRTLLVEFLRDAPRLTGTHVGCDTGQCGACTVHRRRPRGEGVQRCSPRRRRARRSLTIEGLAAADGTLHPMQAAFKRVPRAAMRLLHAGHGDERDRPRERAIRMPTKKTIREELEGNLCRCTGYHNIVKAVQHGAAAMAQEGGTSHRAPT